MKTPIDVHFVCERLRKFGFAENRHIRLYGEDLDLVSNPVPRGNGFAVEAVNRRTGNSQLVGIPLSLISILKRELALRKQAAGDLIAA
jgi:Fe2+ transport system protein FeoA